MSFSAAYVDDCHTSIAQPCAESYAFSSSSSSSSSFSRSSSGTCIQTCLHYACDPFLCSSAHVTCADGWSQLPTPTSSTTPPDPFPAPAAALLADYISDSLLIASFMTQFYTFTDKILSKFGEGAEGLLLSGWHMQMAPLTGTHCGHHPCPTTHLSIAAHCAHHH